MVRPRAWLRGATPPVPADAGQALVEFALVLPLLLVLVIAVFEFGRAWSAYQVITDAAREGARNAVVVNPAIDSAYVVQRVRDALARASLDPDNASISISGFNERTGTPAMVTISYPYRFVLLGPLLGWATDRSSITLSTSFVMRNE
ncbi:MAG TPA: TadE family protein [Longimicrobiales bacterium]